MKTSIIIPVHNRRDYLREAVESLLSENIRELEIFIVDDGSTDGTVRAVEDLPVKICRLAHHQGVAAARNHGMRLCSGEFVGFLDSDDRLAPGGLQWRIEYLRYHFKADAVAGEIAGVIDREGAFLGFYLSLFGLKSSVYPGTTSVTLFRRSFLNHLGFFDERLQVADDKEFCLRALKAGNVAFLPKAVHYYRVHDSNLSIEKKHGRYQARAITRAEDWLVTNSFSGDKG